MAEKVRSKREDVPEEPLQPLAVSFFFWFPLMVTGLLLAVGPDVVRTVVWEQMSNSGLVEFVSSHTDRFLASPTGVYLFEGWHTYETKNWPLMSPWFVWGMVLAYVSFVFAGQAFMRTRRPIAIKPLIMLYNLITAALSMYMTYTIVTEHRGLGYSLFGNHSAESDIGITKVVFIFFASKCFEFLDTAWMILRKNNHQVTFLHVYHHAIIFPYWWFIVLGYPNGDSYFTALLNSFVHSIMYTYYFLTTINIRPPGKFMLTWLQQLQFVTALGQCAYGFYTDFSRPRIYHVSLTVFLVTMLALFGNYQIKEYVLKVNDKKRRAKDSASATLVAAADPTPLVQSESKSQSSVVAALAVAAPAGTAPVEKRRSRARKED